jgi:hypothetical protein
MNTNNRHFLAERIVFKQAIAFMAIMTFIFFNEVYNLSGRLIGAPSSSNLLTKLIFDGVFVAIVGLYIVNHTQRMLRRMKSLEGIVPVCSACKKIRDDDNRWHDFESYISDKSEAKFTHGICPECVQELYPEFSEQILRMDEN